MIKYMSSAPSKCGFSFRTKFFFMADMILPSSKGQKRKKKLIEVLFDPASLLATGTASM